MKYKITFILLFLGLYLSYGQAIYSNEITDSNPADYNPYTNGEITDANISASGISRGPGIIGVTNPIVANSYTAYGWYGVLNLDDYFEITITPNSGYQIDFSSFKYIGSTTSVNGQLPPSLIAIRSSIDGFSNNIGSPNINGATIDLSSGSYQNITTPITFRIYAWGRSELGTFGIDSFEFNGSVDLIPCTGAVITTWSNGVWENGEPDTSTIVIIDEAYNTFANGSFSACSLIINNTLTVTDNGFVEVENDITVNGALTISSKGSVVQNDKNSEFIDNSNNSVTSAALSVRPRPAIGSSSNKNLGLPASAIPSSSNRSSPCERSAAST